MNITFLRNQTKDPKQARDLLLTRIGRILERFSDHISDVTIRVREKVIGEHGTPRASLAVDCALSRGGFIRVGAKDTQLLPAIAKLCGSLQDTISRDPRLGARKPRSS